MISKLHWQLIKFVRKIWVKVALFALLGIVTALISIYAKQFIPWEVPGAIGSKAVDGILNILASSMLAVTTFSLSIMVTAYSSAASNVTPRATRLLMEDPTTHNVLGTFIGSFLYSLVGIVALSTGAYGDGGRVLLFVTTIGIILLIVVTMLRWIEHLSHLGRVSETTDRVEQATYKAIKTRAENPYLGAMPLKNKNQIPENAVKVSSVKVGYVQHIDMQALEEFAVKTESKIYILAIPGKFVYLKSEIVLISQSVSADQEDDIRSCFSISDQRTYDQDLRFGFCVLAEIASKALSPALNDPGTAIDVIGRAVRLFGSWIEITGKLDDYKPKYKNVLVSPLKIIDMFNDVFSPIARDGKSIFEVQIRLQKAFLALAEMGDREFKDSAKYLSERALQLSKSALLIEADQRAVAEISEKIPK